MSRSSLIICLLAMSCSEQKFTSISETDDVGGSEIRVNPEFIPFGSAGRDDDPVVKQFEVRSVGGTPVTIDGLYIDSDVSSFTILTDLVGMVLAPGELVMVDVAFEPMAAEGQSAQAFVTSDADFPPEVWVDLAGEGTIPELEITPDELTIGDTLVGCEKDAPVLLKNVGNDTLEIYDVTLDGEAFELTTSLDLPLSLEPAESVEVRVGFEPNEEATFVSTLTVESNEPLGTREATQNAAGEYGAFYEDNWVVPSDPPSDIVFYVDQSGSMDDDQARLASNFSTFITELATYSNDWQIIVANADNGCNAHSGVLTPDAVNYETRFQTAVSSGGGFWTEAGLTITSEAIDKTDVGECNWGFLRPDAMLHIIMVSDEAEQSSSSWTWYMDKIVAKKGSTANVKFSAIAGDYPGGCSTADAGDGYYQPVMATDGVFLSICSDWATPSNLSMLAAASVQMTAFELDASPSQDTIRVYVNGTERLDGWRYDEGDNTVVFEDGIPQEDDEVKVTYGGMGVCD